MLHVGDKNDQQNWSDTYFLDHIVWRPIAFCLFLKVTTFFSKVFRLYIAVCFLKGHFYFFHIHAHMKLTHHSYDLTLICCRGTFDNSMIIRRIIYRPVFLHTFPWPPSLPSVSHVPVSVCILYMSLYAFSICLCMHSLYFSICILYMSLYAFSICLCMHSLYVSICILYMSLYTFSICPR